MNNTEYCGAVDIGGTKISVGIADSNGKVLLKQIIPTPSDGEPLRTIVEISQVLQTQARELHLELSALKGIGIGIAGPVDVANGVIKNPYTLPGFRDYKIVEALQKSTGLPTRIDNDVNVALLGEVKLGALYDKTVLFVAFGTGIGVSVWFRREGLYRAGNSSYHPEMGHILVDTEGPSCYCETVGCFESTLSGRALNLQAVERGFLDFDYLYRAAQKNDKVALDFLAICAGRLQRAFWTLMTVFKPELVILGGGFMNGYYEVTSEIIKSRVQPVSGFFNAYEIRSARKDNDSTIAGASTLIFGG